MERLIARVAAVAAQSAGLVRAGERSDFLKRRLTAYLATHGEPVLQTLLQKAERGDAAAIEEMRNVLAVNYTYFWREPEHFQFLLEHLLTTLRKKVGAGGTAPQRLRLWSAACSSGEEAWSMAMVAAEARRLGGRDCQIEVLATDIDTEALAEARTGRYRDEVVQQLPEEYRTRYLQAVRSAGGAQWQVGETLRAIVQFHPLDLLAAQWPVCEKGEFFDAIFCRNVMIYLSDSARFHVFEKFAALLKADGLLFLGRVEGGMKRAEPYFRPCGNSIYLLADAARRAGRHGKHS